MQFPRWLSWLVIIFLAYILFVGNTREPEAPLLETSTVPTSDKEFPRIKALVDGDRWKKAINPDYQSPDEACRVTPPKEGALASYAVLLQESTEYEPAKCGDDLPLIISPVLPDGRIGPGKAMGYRLGLQPEFDALIVGMRPTEQRLVIFIPSKPIVSLPFAKPGKVQILHVTYPLDVID